ncbi:chemotaxis protein CheD [Pelagimonas sp. KU-00592-HH]|uniref:chemotaxis protein CheD n=1 Tax=Pelagimonas sp. KU-00592-HH TaxID=3127651 RepID=UPI0033402044
MTGSRGPQEWPLERERRAPQPDPVLPPVVEANGTKTLSVLQGQFRVSDDPNAVMTTILGSCVATCVWDPDTGVGGMNHFLLPGTEKNRSGNLRYGVNSMELLINALLQQGARRENLHLKLFGGARMFGTEDGIGRKNAEFAVWYVETEGLRLVKKCLGGTRGRKVRFWPGSGHAQLKFLQNDWHETLSPETTTPRRRADDSGVVTLF